MCIRRTCFRLVLDGLVENGFQWLQDSKQTLILPFFIAHTWSSTVGAGASSIYKNNTATLISYMAAMPGDGLLAAAVDLDTH